MVLEVAGVQWRFVRQQSDPNMQFGCRARKLMHYSGLKRCKKSKPESEKQMTKKLVAILMMLPLAGIFVISLIGEASLAQAPIPIAGDFGYSPWLFPDSDSRYLTPGELAALSPDELWIARNEIYARRGYIFNTARGKAYARSLGDAYMPLTKNPRFNRLEQKNIQLIQQFESRR